MARALVVQASVDAQDRAAHQDRAESGLGMDRPSERHWAGSTVRPPQLSARMVLGSRLTMTLRKSMW